ncbi:MAG TPA: hypothetical protein VL633_04780, partial [Bacteroidota bacterium]|nr:hypothetical protein [Bacteroidota bacterium]
MESNPANLRPPYFLLCLCLVFFTLMTTGSILSPDSEIVYRVGESIANSGTFSLDHELEGWPGFGTARGIDGKIYSVFGPLESIILAPCIKIAGFIDQTGWYNAVPALIPLSYHIDAGLQRRFYHQPATRLEPHAVRFLVSFLNVIVSLLCVYVFWRIVMNLVRDRTIAVISSIVYAFGTMMWNYSGSLFSEPLATLFVLASLDAAVSIDTQQVPEPGYGKSALLSGLYLGLAVAAHLSAILFIPFFAGYVIWTVYRRKGNISAGLRAAIFWTVGCGLILLLLGYYNVIRFGNWFETGRGVNPNAVRQFGYGEFVAPWQGLWGLLVSPSKGIFIYSPALVLGLIGWRKLHRSWKSLSWMLLL